MKKEKHHINRTVPKSNRKIGAKSIPFTHKCITNYCLFTESNYYGELDIVNVSLKCTCCLTKEYLTVKM